MFIIDLDDTLLDTQAFKQVRINALQNLGVSEELYKKSYQEAYIDKSGISVYNSFVHAEALAKYGFTKEKILHALQQTEINLKNLVFTGAEELLNFLRELGQKLILLSLGERSFQEMKITQTGLAKYFDVIFTMNDSKEYEIEKFLSDFPYEEAWLINDKVEETKELKTLFPILKPLLKVSPVFSRQEYEASGLPFFNSLTEIQQYVRDQYAK